jgi:hypothetical protein
VEGEVDGDVEDVCPLGKVHAEEEDVSPSAVAQVHADGRALMENREAASSIAMQEFGRIRRA